MSTSPAPLHKNMLDALDAALGHLERRLADARAAVQEHLESPAVGALPTGESEATQ